MKKQLTKMDFWVLAVVLALIAGVFVKGRVMRRLPEISSSYSLPRLHALPTTPPTLPL